ncbi:MAG: hypothetical protein JXQ99_24190 [Hyphomicrobiaceae bacterium]
MSMTDYLLRVEEALSSGRLWRAKEILQGRLADARYDVELFEAYGNVLRKMGDLRLAGKFLFLSGVRSAEADPCIEIFKAHDCKGPFSSFWKNMPRAVQNSPRSEVPSVVMNDLISLGFDRSEIVSVFDALERRIEEKRNNDGTVTTGRSDWLGFAFVGGCVALLLGLIYQSVVGVVALVKLAVGWNAL